MSELSFFSLTPTMSGKAMTVVLEGALDAEELEDVSEMLFRLALRGSLQVVVDVSRVSTLDPSGVHFLVEQVALFRELGGDLRLCGLTARVRGQLVAGGARNVFKAYPGQPEALASFVVPLPVSLGALA